MADKSQTQPDPAQGHAQQNAAPSQPAASSTQQNANPSAPSSNQSQTAGAYTQSNTQQRQQHPLPPPHRQGILSNTQIASDYHDSLVTVAAIPTTHGKD